MAGENIKTRISLEGGNEIKSQFDALGAAGKKAFADLSAAAGSAGSAGFDAVKGKVADVTKTFGDLKNGVRDLGGSIGDSVTRIGLVVGAVSAAAVGFGLLVKSAAESAEAVRNTAAAVGLTIQSFQSLSFAASQAGIGQEQFTGGLEKFNRAVDETAKTALEFQKKQNSLRRDMSLGRISTHDYTAALKDLAFEQEQTITPFTRLGIVFENTGNNLKSNRENLLRTADAFRAAGNSINAPALAMQLFGRSNAQFVQALKGGRQGIIELEREAERLMIPLDKLTIESGENLANAFRKLEQVSGSTKTTLLSTFNPIVASVVNAFTEAIVRNRASAIELASTIASNVKPIIDDLIATIEGRDKDVKNSTFIKFRDAAIDFGTAVKKAVTEIIIPALELLLKGLDLTARAINSVFGTSFTGGELAAALVIGKVLGLFGVLAAGARLAAIAVRGIFLVFGGPLIGAFLLGFAGFIVAMDAIRGKTTSVKDVFDGLKKTWDGIFGGDAKTGIADTSSEFSKLQEQLRNLGKSSATGATEVKQQLSGIQQKAKETSNEIETTTRSLGGRAVLITVEQPKQALDAVKAKAQQTAVEIAKVPTQIKQVVDTVKFDGIERGMITLGFELNAQALKSGDQVVQAYDNANERVKQSFTALWSGGLVSSSFEKLGAPVQRFVQGLAASFDTASVQLGAGAEQSAQKIVQAFTSANDRVEQAFTDLDNKTENVFDSIADDARDTAQQMRDAFQGIGGLAGGGLAGGGGSGFARGGPVWGAGTSTSDSIRALLSRGEFVQPTRAVNYYGRAFMESIRRLQFPRFSMGGLVERLGALMPPPLRLASGGLASGGGGTPVNLHIGSDIFNLLAPDKNTAERLTRYAISRQLHSAGRKPSFYGR